MRTVDVIRMALGRGTRYVGNYWAHKSGDVAVGEASDISSRVHTLLLHIILAVIASKGRVMCIMFTNRLHALFFYNRIVLTRMMYHLIAICNFEKVDAVCGKKLSKGSVPSLRLFF